MYKQHFFTNPFLPQVEWVSHAKETTSVIFPLKKHTSAVFYLSHDTKWEHFEAFLARIVANLIQKFKTQSLSVTSQMTRWRYADAITSRWRYADRSDDITWARLQCDILLSLLWPIPLLLLAHPTHQPEDGHSSTRHKRHHLTSHGMFYSEVHSEKDRKRQDNYPVHWIQTIHH
jgi:hypothetical protein